MPESYTYPIPGFNDPFSSLTHLIGAGVFLALSFFLLKRAWGDLGRFFAFAVFSFSCVFMLSMSGVYHLLSDGGAGRLVLQRLDHASIFVLIAGTITPVHQVLFKGFMRWGWIAVVWALAITAITLKTIFFTAVPEWLGLLLYLGLGWLGAVTGGVLWYREGTKYAAPILWGGLSYSIGAILDLLQQPVLINGVIGAHELFHLFVLLGISLHWRFVHRLTRLKGV